MASRTFPPICGISPKSIIRMGQIYLDDSGGPVVWTVLYGSDWMTVSTPEDDGTALVTLKESVGEILSVDVTADVTGMGGGYFPIYANVLAVSRQTFTLGLYSYETVPPVLNNAGGAVINILVHAVKGEVL